MLGVWPDGSDGSDINAAHRSNDGQLVLTADDFGGLKLFHAPCAAHLASHTSPTIPYLVITHASSPCVRPHVSWLSPIQVRGRGRAVPPSHGSLLPPLRGQLPQHLTPTRALTLTLALNLTLT